MKAIVGICPQNLISADSFDPEIEKNYSLLLEINQVLRVHRKLITFFEVALLLIKLKQTAVFVDYISEHGGGDFHKVFFNFLFAVLHFLKNGVSLG